MKKTKIILASIGGLALLGVLVVGGLMFNAFSTKSELTEELGLDEMKLSQLRTAKVAPTLASLKQVETNKAVLVNWLTTTRAAVAVGDRASDPAQTDASFKSKMIDDARELSALPGGAAGKIVKENFGFGYTDFITGGKMPTVAELPELQMRWADIVTFIKLFASNGVKEVVEVASLAPAAAKEEPTARRGQRPAKAKAKESDEKAKITQREYEFKLRADAPALIRVLNACAVDPRFTLVESLTFARAEDEIATRIGESNKAQANENRRSRRRRASAATELVEANAEEVAKKGLVIDPATVSPFAVTLRVATVDFGSQQVEKKSEKKEEGTK